MKLIQFGFLVVLLALGGCAAYVDWATQGVGRAVDNAEVTINSNDLKLVKSVVMKQMEGLPPALYSEDDSRLLYRRNLGNEPEIMKHFGGSYGVAPVQELIFTFTSESGFIRVVAANYILTNPDTAFEERTLANAKAGVEPWQRLLDQAKIMAEKPSLD